MLKLRCRHDPAPALRYFCTASALSAEERAGRWMGTGSRLLALEGAVDVDHLNSVLHGFAPSSTPLFSALKPGRRCGWEMTLSPSKSVSIVATCLEDQSDRERAMEAWQRTIAEMVRVTESLACRQNAGRAYIPTGNVIAAVFDHTASRHGDPHLHAHVLLANATLDPIARKWRSLEPSPLYKAQSSLDSLFHRELARQLQIQGFDASLDHNGFAQLPVPSPALTRLSTAHRVIQAATAKKIPKEISRLNFHNAQNRLNDRLRPAKGVKPRFKPTEALTPSEQNEIKKRLRLPSPVTFLAPALKTLKTSIQTALNQLSFLLTPATRWKAVARTAAADLSAPIGDLAQAAVLVSAPPRPAAHRSLSVNLALPYAKARVQPKPLPRPLRSGTPHSQSPHREESQSRSPAAQQYPQETQPRPRQRRR